MFSAKEYNSSIEELSNKLSKYKEGITYEISAEKDGKKEFIISADGIEELFSKVKSLYDAAPKIQRWTIISFRPRMENFARVNLKYAGKEFDPTKLWIYHRVQDGYFDLIIYHPEYSEEEKNILVSGAYILLDTALGEYDVVTGIRYIDHQQLPKDPEKEGLIPFIQLRDVFDDYKLKNTH